MSQLRNYEDFVAALLDCGFSLGGGNPKGVYSVIPFGWEDQEKGGVDSPLRWHTEDPETDPWEFRMRVLQERSDIAYAKLFFRVSGFITRAWYPAFLAVRRGGGSFDEAYEAGRLSYAAKRIYQAAAGGPVALPELKRLAGFEKGEAAAFDRALTDLQMGLYLTICGQRRRQNQYGAEYGWNCSMLCTTEQFWGPEVFDEAAGLDPAEAEAAIRAQISKLNPAAKEAAVKRFVRG